jgi:hypothetical protein
MIKFLILIMTTSIACYGYADNNLNLVANNSTEPQAIQFDPEHDHIAPSAAPRHMLQATGSAPHPHLYALHINGINTTKREAETNKAELQKAAQVTSDIQDFLKWDIVYNPTASSATEDTKMHTFANLYHNVMTVFTQKNLEIKYDNIYFQEYMFIYLAWNPINIDSEKYPAEYKKAYDKVAQDLYPHYEELTNNLYKVANTAVINDFHAKVPAQFQSVVNLLKQDQTVGENYANSYDSVLLIPHSQGNMYANMLANYLKTKEKFNSSHIGIFGIASPADGNDAKTWWTDYNPATHNPLSAIRDKIPTANSYITSCNDRVVEGLRLQRGVADLINKMTPFTGVTPYIVPCTTSATGGSDMFNHNLIDYYLAVPALRDTIVTQINYALYYLYYKQLEDIVYHMVPPHRHENNFPNDPYAFVFTYNKYNSQIVGEVDVNSDYRTKPLKKILWSPNTSSYTLENGLIDLNTPILDKVVEQYGYAMDEHHPSALTHFIGVPSSTVFTKGFSPTAIYGVYEDIRTLQDKYYYALELFPYNEEFNKSTMYSYVTPYNKPTVVGTYQGCVFMYDLRTTSYYRNAQPLGGGTGTIKQVLESTPYYSQDAIRKCLDHKYNAISSPEPYLPTGVFQNKYYQP